MCSTNKSWKVEPLIIFFSESLVICDLFWTYDDPMSISCERFFCRFFDDPCTVPPFTVLHICTYIRLSEILESRVASWSSQQYRRYDGVNYYIYIQKNLNKSSLYVTIHTVDASRSKNFCMYLWVSAPSFNRIILLICLFILRN